MNRKELIDKGEIGIEDNIDFRTHADVLRLFGMDRKVIQPSYIKHPHEDGVRIWFPMFYDDANNDWENTSTKDFESVFERRKVDNAGHLKEQLEIVDQPIRILFAKIAPFGKVFYKFKGIYKFDPELSITAKKVAFRRIATAAKLYPVR